MLVTKTCTQLEKYVPVDDNVATKALLNPLILHKVLCSLDTTTLKACRLVCTLWADVGATYLGRQGRLAFSAPPNRTKSEELTSFNHDLVKNVELLFYTKTACCCPDICTCLTKLPSNFVIILPEIFDKLETLEFFYAKAFQPFQEIWSTNDFPHLTQISIIADGEDLDKNAPPSREMGQFRLLPNLKVFSLKMSPCCDSSQPLMSSICQNLVNSAPNLDDLDVVASFHLDLSACKKLKTVRYKFHFERYTRFYIEEFAKMLESCRNSLESLTLGYFGWGWDQKEKLDFHFPNLTNFRFNAVDVYYSIKDSLNVTNLPKLTHFSMSSIEVRGRMYDLSEMIQHCHSRHVGVTSLDICCTHYPQIDNRDGAAARVLGNLFPAVKEFKLKLMIQFFGDHEDDQYLLGLMEMMQSFGVWELTCGQVDFEIKSELNDNPGRELFRPELIIAVLRGMAGWIGLANTTLQFNGQLRLHAAFRLVDEMRDALLSCRTIQSVAFTGFLMDEETKLNFQTFIGENNLPISVKY